MHATIDFETRSEIDVTKVGSYKYAEHPSTVPLCLAYNLTGNPKDTKLWEPSEPDPEDLFEHIENGGLVEAHNAMFENCIWNMVMVEKYLWPTMPLDQWRCSMAKARAASIPGSLDRAGEYLNLKIQKDTRGKELIRLLCKPQKITKTNTEKWNNSPELLQELYDYCIQDVNTEMELSKKLPRMPESEIQVWLLDQLINWRGVYIDKDTVHTTLKIMEQAKVKYELELFKISKGRFSTAGQRDKILAWCESKGVYMPGFTKEDVARTLQTELPKDVERVLQIRQILGRTSTAKYTAMLEKSANDGRIHEVLVYHKAHTGRWGGAGVQLQNLPRPTLDENPEDLIDVLSSGSLDEVEAWYENPFEVAACAIRPMITAAPGKVLISADYSAIEARILLWLADDQDGLDLFRNDMCIYSDMAADIYNTNYETVYNGYKKGSFVETEMRKFGKDTILGLGYQMGAPKFRDTCIARGVDITDKEFYERVVYLYRQKYHKVKKLWNGLNEAAMSALQNLGETHKYSLLAYKFDGYYLKCKLPSGRCIHYPNAHLDLTETSWGEEKLTVKYNSIKEGKVVTVSTYGGKLTENPVQAIARDIMAYGLLQLEANNYPVIMSVHDEAVSEVPINSNPNLQHYCKTLCTLAPWAKGLPLKAAGWIGHCYRK